MRLTEFDPVPPDDPLTAALNTPQHIRRPLWQGVALAALDHPQNNLDVECAPFVQDDNGGWQVSRWVGTFTLGKETYQIVPRIGEERFRIIAAQALFAAIVKGKAGAMETRHARLLDVLPLVWYVAFEAGTLRHGVPKTYVRRESTSCSELRGSLDLARQLTENFIERQQIACSWDDLTVDNAINQATRLAIGHLRTHRRFPYVRSGGFTQSKLEHWRERLPLMGVAKVTRFPLERVRWSRANDGFRAAHRLARYVTEDRGFQPGGSQLDEAVFVDTAEIWELYLRERLRAVVRTRFPDYRLEWPRASRTDCLLVWGQRPVRGLIPDFRIVRKTDNQAVAILDAKYRRFRPMADDQETATQMALYVATSGAGENNTLPAAALIYPRAEDLDPGEGSDSNLLGRGRFRMGRPEPTLIAWAIKLESPDNEVLFHANVDKQLGELVSVLISDGTLKRH
jgi:5-methylcytosine-specific restriction enzyme subunit McrC